MGRNAEGNRVWGKRLANPDYCHTYNIIFRAKHFSDSHTFISIIYVQKSDTSFWKDFSNNMFLCVQSCTALSLYLSTFLRTISELLFELDNDRIFIITLLTLLKYLCSMRQFNNISE